MDEVVEYTVGPQGTPERASPVNSDDLGARSGTSTDIDTDEEELELRTNETALKEYQNETTLPSKCLFCDEIDSDSSSILYGHLKTHGIDFFEWQIKYHFDQLSYIRFVNYFRKMRERGQTSEKSINDFKERCNSILSHEKYLIPVDQEDGLLVHFIQDMREELSESEICQNGYHDNDSRFVATPELVKQLREEIREQNHNMELLRERFRGFVTVMRETMRRVVDEPVDKDLSPQKPNKSNDNRDAWYFDSYDEIEIHTAMLMDKPRTEAYMKSIMNNKTDFTDKVVLDVGCGTGILSMFAAKAGAKQVYAIDNAKIILEAIDIIKENGLDATVKCLAGKVEQSMVLKTNEMVDILISEWMGYFLLQEAMLKSVLYARDNYLKKDGLMFPNKAALYIVAADNQQGHYESFSHWDDVYGFKMTAMKIKARNNTIVGVIKEHEVVSYPALILDLDLMKCDMSDTIINQTFHLAIKRDCHITSLVGYFDVGFTMGSNYSHTLRTGPDSIPTHWSQTVFHLSTTKFAREDEKIRCHIKCHPSPENERQMDIELQVGDHKQNYELR